MSDPKEIYLAPKCCPDPEFGRCWATDDEWPLAPGDEDNGHYPATRYVRADLTKPRVTPLDEDDYEEIVNAAAANMRKATSGVRGQVITVQDSLDWWVMKETERRILSALEGGGGDD